VEINSDLEYEVSEVLNSKINNRHCCKLLYLVRWLGYEGTDKETSWLPATEIDHTQELLSDFHAWYLDKPGPL